MRAGTWATFRDIAAAHTSWRRVRRAADRLPDDDPDRMAMRIEPHSLLCASAFRVGGRGADTGFDELPELCTTAGDQRSLAIGMGGLVIAHNLRANYREASRLASELVRLLESIGDSTLTVALLSMPMIAKHETAEMAEILCLAEHLIDLTDGDPAMGNLITDSPLSVATALRGVARGCLGVSGWKDDVRRAVAMARSFAPMTFAGVVWYTYILTIPNGLLVPDTTAEADTAEALALAEQSGDDLALDLARTVRGVNLVYQGGPEREVGLELLEMIRERVLNERFSMTLLPIANICTARYEVERGNLDGVIEFCRRAVGEVFHSGAAAWSAPTVAVLVETLLRRGSDADLREARPRSIG